jgi:hypothetical protein
MRPRGWTALPSFAVFESWEFRITRRASARSDVRKPPHRWLPRLSRPPEVVLRLHVHPQFRRGTQSGRQPDSHQGRDSRLAIQHARQSHACNPQMRCCLRYGEISEIFPENQPWMRRIVHGYRHFLVLLYRSCADRDLASDSPDNRRESRPRLQT